MKVTVEYLAPDSALVAVSDDRSGHTWKLSVVAARAGGAQLAQHESVLIKRDDAVIFDSGPVV